MKQTGSFQPKTSGMYVTLTYLQRDLSQAICWLFCLHSTCCALLCHYICPDEAFTNL